MSFFEKWNKNNFSVYKSEETTVLKILENLNKFVGDLTKGIDNKTDLNGNHLGQWQGLNKPTLSDEGLKATVEKLTDQDIPGINNNIFNLNGVVENNKNQLTDEMKEIENFNLNISMGVDTEVDYIYPKDKLKLLGTTWSYYDGEKFPLYYPSVTMDKNGVLVFSGNAQVRGPLKIVDGLVEFAQIYHFDITNFEGIPLRGRFIGVSDDDTNAMIDIPYIIKTDGKIYLKNIGEGNKAYNRIDLNNSTIQTSCFGQQFINENLNETIKKAEKIAPNATQFVYFTDIHHNINNYRKYEQLKAIKKVCNHLDIKAVITGGDNIQESSSRITAIKTHRDIYAHFKKDKFIYCNGNHDLNIMGGNETYVHPVHIKPHFNNSKMVFGGPTKYYSYMDIEESRLRIIVLDSYETQFDTGITPGASPNVSLEQLQWHIDNSMNLQDTNINKVMFVSHTPPTEKIIDEDTILPNRQLIRNILKDFKNGTGAFTKQGKKDIVCWLFGHEHRDKIINFEGITYVGNLLAWSQVVNYQNPGEVYRSYTREYGTEYEFAFDIVSIVENERKVYFHRVGRKTVQGDRIISY